MLFDSLTFLIAFPVFTVVFLNAPAWIQPRLMLLGSLVACATFGWVSLVWLILVTLIGFHFGRSIESAASTQRLWAAILLLLAPLLLLKYTDFVIDAIDSALAYFATPLIRPRFNFSLPVGISFYTFVVLGYVIDVHVSRTRAERSIAKFALFTAFYPKLVAGPVERQADFSPQIDTPKRFDYARVTDGMRIIGSGLFKKLVVADRLSVVVNGVYANPDAYGGTALILTSLCYMFQLYYDFCGYSEIAVGSAKVLGYDLIWNFNRPYAARSISDYWRRWHISLTSWFFEYVFAPVSALLRRRRRMAVICGLLATFLVSGLWHGARWTFICYGLVHGIAISIDYLTARPRKRFRRWIPAPLYASLAWAITFAFVACADVLFRSDSIMATRAYLYRAITGLAPDLRFLTQHHFSAASMKALIAGLPIPKMDLVLALGTIVVIELAGYWGRERPFRQILAIQPLWIRWPAYYLVAGAIVYLGSQNAATMFIYMKY
jgi:D-alanyl-lipoteichoic acid acyltransferase DltB (MBOAT superfamily)